MRRTIGFPCYAIQPWPFPHYARLLPSYFHLRMKFVFLTSVYSLSDKLLLIVPCCVHFHYQQFGYYNILMSKKCKHKRWITLCNEFERECSGRCCRISLVVEKVIYTINDNLFKIYLRCFNINSDQL